MQHPSNNKQDKHPANDNERYTISELGQIKMLRRLALLNHKR